MKSQPFDEPVWMRRIVHMRKEDKKTGSTGEFRNGLYVLHLRGNPYERGEAHGRLLGNEIRDSHVSPYFGRFLMDLYMSSDFADRVPAPLRKWFGEIIEWWYYSPLERLVMKETREELYGIADAAGLERKETIRAVLAPDIMSHLAAGFLKSGKEALGNYYLGGCSGAYARGTALSPRGKSLFARNMDFPGVFVWKYPVVLFNHPTEEVPVFTRGAGSREGGDLKEEGRRNEGREEGGAFRWENRRKAPYVYISTAGFPGHGLTGMNANGVAMSAFVCLSRNYSRKRMTFLDFNHYLFTRTDSLSGIRQLLETEQYSCASPHTVLFADKEDAFSVEVDSKRAAVVPITEGFDYHVQTNHFVNPLMKQEELEFPLEREYTIGRYRLIRDILEYNYGHIDVQKMVDTLSCNLDRGTKGPRLLGDFPAQFFTLTSVVFEPESGRFWVADGRPPAVCYNRYGGFNLFDEIEQGRNNRRIPSFKKSSRPVLQGTEQRAVTGEERDALYHLSLSQELLNNGRVPRAIRQLEEAYEHYSDPSFEYIRGIVLLIAGRYQEGCDVLYGLKQNHIFSPVKDTALGLWLGRAYDLVGKREKALTVYREVLKSSILVKHLREAVERCLHHPFTPAGLPKTFDYYLMGPLEF